MNRALVVITFAVSFSLAGCISGWGGGIGAHRQNGDIYYANGQWANAAEHYEKYLDARAGDPDIRANLARAYMNLGEPAKAADHLRLVHAQQPGNAAITDQLSDALFAAGKNDELFRTLRSEAVDRQTMTDWLRLGNYAIKLGDKDTAQIAYLAAAKVDGGANWRSHIALYDFYRSMGLKTEAIERLRMAAFVAPNETEVTRRIAEATGPKSGVITGPTFALRPLEWGKPETTSAPSWWDIDRP